MESFVHYTNCPVCKSSDLKKNLKAVDFTVSKKEFEILECAHCSLRFTQDPPDADSISFYYKSEDYISHTNSSKGLINKLYQIVRSITLKQKQHNIEQNTGLKTGHLLDVGSGTGLFVKQMKDHGWQVTGLEPDEDARELAYNKNNVQLFDIDMMEKLNNESFDAISLWHVLEHVHELESFIARLKALLKPSGTIFIALPNYTSLDAAHYKNNWAAYDVPRHLYHFSPASMEELMKRNGLKMIKHQPMWFDSFYISLLSSKYETGTIKIFSGFFNGLKSNFYAWKNPQKCSSIIYLVKKMDV